MHKFIRIIYISRSTFQPIEKNDIEPGVARILSKSRSNNRKKGLVGVLYFGNGYFFQCLEGPHEQVDALYAKLQDDPRHTDLKVLARHSIDKPSFVKWDMKYVKLDQPTSLLLAKRGHKEFDPYKFDEQTIQDLIKFFKLAPDVESLDILENQISNVELHQQLKHYKKKVSIALSLSAISLSASLAMLAWVVSR
jgi:hypothetical protein